MTETPCGRAPSCSLTLAAAAGVRLPSPPLRSGVVAGNVVPIGVARGPTVSRRYLGRAGLLLCRDPRHTTALRRGGQATQSEPYVPFESFHEKSRTVERGTSAVPPLRISKPLAVHLPPNRQRRPQPSPGWPRSGPEHSHIVGARLAAVRFCEPSLVMFRSWPSVASQSQVRTVNRT